MFLVLWEFEVKPGQEKRFERVYGPGSDWEALFQRDPNHDSTHLYHDAVRPGVYLTADHWRSRESYEEFRKTRRAEYESLDAAGEELTASERHIGSYETLEAM